MVRVGNHSLEIVSASTRQPLVEYSHKGETWIKGTRGEEYFIRITSHNRGTYTVASPIKIDGSNIGYNFQQGPDINLTATLGPINERVANSGIQGSNADAFRFSSPENGNNVDGIPIQGSISVTWSEARDSHQPNCHLYYADWQEGDKIATVDAKKEGVGLLKSSRGSTEVNVPVAAITWIPERELYTATIKYCEEAGLVVRGILQPQAIGSNEDTKCNNTLRREKRKREPVVPVSSNVVDLTNATIKREGRPKREESGAPDNVIVID